MNVKRYDLFNSSKKKNTMPIDTIYTPDIRCNYRLKLPSKARFLIEIIFLLTCNVLLYNKIRIFFHLTYLKKSRKRLTDELLEL